MTRYRSIPMEIEAIKAVNGNIDEVKAFAGDAFVEDGGYGYPHLKVQDGYHQIIHWGDWIAKDENGFRLMLTRDIQNFFEEIEDPPKFATGGFIEGPSTPITIDLSREHLITADEAHHWTAETSPFRRMVLDRWVKAGRPINAEEAREAEEAGLRVVEATAFEDDEPVFLPAEEAREGDRKRPEQGHIVNGPRSQAALEDFRQKYGRGEIDE